MKIVWVAYVVNEEEKVIRLSVFEEEKEMNNAVKAYSEKFGAKYVHYLSSRLGELFM